MNIEDAQKIVEELKDLPLADPPPCKASLPKARITSVSVARLYNLGNYSNVRYDLAAEVPEGASAKNTLATLRGILQLLKPVRVPDCINDLREALAKEPVDRSNWENDHLEEWGQQVAKYESLRSARAEALKSLDDLGGSSFAKDAKDDWDEDSDVDGGRY